jgi:peptidoglycan/xylan/chitin deacetylase (PgdA/CDA1 family)
MDEGQRDIIALGAPRHGKFGGSSFFGANPIGLTAEAPLSLPTTFPNGAQAAVLMTFDVEGTYGNGQGDMAVEVENYFRICERLADLGLKATFHVVGRMAEEQGPEFVRAMDECGSEVASHGQWHDIAIDAGYPFHGQYGIEVNRESIHRSCGVLSDIIGSPVNGIRLPYGHLNEHSYEAIEEEGLAWASNVAIEDYQNSELGYGCAPFRPVINGRPYGFVEIPLDSQTYDWSIWIADENNAAFIERVKLFADREGIALERTPSGAVTIWQAQIAKAIRNRSCFTLLCHPINLAVMSEHWGDPVEEFLFPIFDILAARQRAGEISVPTCGEMADITVASWEDKS